MTFLKDFSIAISLFAALAVVETGCGGPAQAPAGSNGSGGSGGSSGSSGGGSSGSGSSGSSGDQPLTSDGITVTSPTNGAAVSAPFPLTASAANCASQPVSSIGYSLDGSTSATVVSGTSIDTQVSADAGTHTVQVSSWGSQGATCGAALTVAVTNSSSPEQSMVPPNATTVSSLQTEDAWRDFHDRSTPGGSSGAMSIVSSPSLSGQARQFVTSFSKSGGENYNLIFGNDDTSTNFFYDAWVYLTSSTSNMANLEMDINQVLANGDTVIYGFQCDGYSNTWDYTANVGSLAKPHDTWKHSGVACNVANWAKNTWHHVQIGFSRDDSGNVTYQSVWLDGTESTINATVLSSFALGWAPVLQTNFQVDGRGSGKNTILLDELTISRW